MSFIVNPDVVTHQFHLEIKNEVSKLDEPLKIVGFLSTDGCASHTYAQYTKLACEEMGMIFELRELRKAELEAAISHANDDDTIHGIFVYYPLFNNEQDVYIRDQVDPSKDVEGLCQYWTSKLYANDRFAVDGDKVRKAILPCTPLAIVKLLEAAGAYGTTHTQPLLGKVVSIFNRSEVVGRPLAVMLANDGAIVYSFDVDGPLLFDSPQPKEISISRAGALAQSDIVITGVPCANFSKVHAGELKPGVIAFNFSTYENLADDVAEFADKTILRVGPVTVAMCMRNALRLYRNFRLGSSLEL